MRHSPSVSAGSLAHWILLGGGLGGITHYFPMLVMQWLAVARVLGKAEENTVLKTIFRELRCNAVFI